MDPAVRASLKGWEFLFVKNELPNTFNAYRYQQHSGHLVQLLFKKMSKEILLCKEDHRTLVTFFFYCIVILSCVLIPEVSLKKQIDIYIQATITILNALSTPRSIHLLVSWILFENVMSHHRTKATITGLLKVNRVNEWVSLKMP
ncbi:glucomannan 4-beta-mannosyltransferase 1-like isoform X2 [Arachis hypogaea]|uniref:glucomannan 4-beta-mannosyltransferase 1-like isoform X2 n=1 Tax=Arachis hypogaea TaxID=3818 RepID=UPI003B224FC9|nr:Mannan synthase [Arachis hypogaea]